MAKRIGSKKLGFTIEWRGKEVHGEALEVAATALGRLGHNIAERARKIISRHRLRRPGGYWRRPGAMAEERHLAGGRMQSKPGMPEGGFVWAEFPAIQVDAGTRRSRGLHYLRKARRGPMAELEKLLEKAAREQGLTGGDFAVSRMRRVKRPGAPAGKPGMPGL